MIKIYITSILFFLCCVTGQARYVGDTLGGDFLHQTIHMPDDYEGKVDITLVRKTSGLGADNAILYIHGFNDYFFQKEEAEFFANERYNFYAVDLRKYGRSWMAHQKRGNVRDLNEYFADIDSALYTIRSEGNRSVILVGHSTGGLIASLYLDQIDRRGVDSSFVKGLILNSPFFDMNQSWFQENIAIPLVSIWGRISPSTVISKDINTLYGKSIHASYKGEWVYDLRWKTLESIPVNAAFIKAVYTAQRRLHSGLHITQPVMVMHSSRSVHSETWTDEFMRADAVLDVEDIHSYAACLGDHVSLVVIQDGMHDLALSLPKVRETYYEKIREWLKKNFKSI